jgi:hypothetical protein
MRRLFLAAMWITIGYASSEGEVLTIITVNPVIDPNAYDNPAETPYVKKEVYDQWFTGPIIAFNPITVEVKHPAIESTLVFDWIYGIYGNNGHFNKRPTIFSTMLFVDLEFAANKFIAFELLASASSSFCKGTSFTSFEDTEFNMGFQVSTDTPGTWIPDFRILVEEILPTGNYDRLNPLKFFADLTGQGAFQTGINFIFQKFFPRDKGHNVRISGSAGFLIPSSVRVKGFNLYDGDATTNARVFPGKVLNCFFVAEYAFSRTWGLTVETNFIQQFKGWKPKSAPTLHLPTTYQFSIAPEIQHTLSPDLAIVLGSWFSLLGRNSSAFAQAFFSLLYVF